MSTSTGTPGPEDAHERVLNILLQDQQADFESPFEVLTIAQQNAVVREAFHVWLAKTYPDACRISDVVSLIAQQAIQNGESA